jgi:hypothetical protein
MKTFALMMLMTLAVAVDAAEPPRKLTAQQVAQARADWIVRQPRGHYWHPPYRIANPWRVARFEGCGFGRPGQNVTWSCRPRYRMRLVGDAYATGPIMSVRVRLWR